MTSVLARQDPKVFAAIHGETRREATTLELIASENFVSEAVLEAQGSVLTNKYAEGYPGRRYYGGCEFVDQAEALAIERAKRLFPGSEHVNVQPHSGTGANLAVYFTVLQPGDTLMGLSLAHGGHLSHGHPLNLSGKYFKIVPYSVRQDTERIDMDEVARIAREHRPKLIVAGASAYPRLFDFARFRAICDEVGALLMVDMAHFAGLVAAGVHPSPFPAADFVTTTTHKTLRGPRGGMIFCREPYAKEVDRLVFPGSQGGPLMHVIAAKAVALGEALKPSFTTYQKQIVKNAQRLAAGLAAKGYRIVSGGTDNHLMLVDLRPKGLTGKDAEAALESAGITVNKNMIPFDPEKAMVTSGIRVGTPAVTTRGMKEKEMDRIAALMDDALVRRADPARLKAIRGEVGKLCARFPLYASRLRAR